MQRNIQTNSKIFQYRFERCASCLIFNEESFLLLFSDCMDKYENCKFWKQQGSCVNYWQKNWMKQNCPMSCQVCRRCEVKEKVGEGEEETKSP